MKKLFAIILSALIISSFSISALADTAPLTASSGGSPVTNYSTGYDTYQVSPSTTTINIPDPPSDPMYATVKQDYATIVSLRAQEKTIRDSIEALSKSNGDAEASIRAVLKSQITSARDAEKQANQTIKDETTQLRQQRLSILSQMITAKANKDTATYDTLKTQLAAVNQQIKDDLAKMKTNSQSLNSSQSSYRNLLSQLNTLNSQIETLRAQMYTFESDLDKNQAKIDTDWSSFTASMNSKDYTSADNALKDIIACKQQIISDLNSVVALKQQVSSLLSSFASSLGTASSGSAHA